MAYEAGTAYISVLPTLKGFQSKLKSELEALGTEVNVPVKPKVVPETKEESKKDGEAAGGAFADAFRARVTAALKSLPKAEITAESSDADRKIAEIRAELESLSSKRIGIDIDEADALAKVDALKAELTFLGEHDPRIAVRVDTAEAFAALDEIGAKLDRTLTPDLAPEGERAAGTWAESFRARLEASVASLPDIEIRANSSGVDIAIAEIRAQMDSLSSKRIGVDIDEKSALTQVAALKAALEEISREHPSTEIRVDTMAAAAKLAEITAEVNSLDRKTVTEEVKVDDKGTAAATGQGMSGLMMTMLALAPAALPIAAAVVPAIAGIGVAAVAAGAALGVIKMGLSGISEALSAMDAQDTASVANAQSNANATRDAVRGLADARAAAAESAISSAERVAGAQQSLSDAERTSAEQVKAALQRQAAAEQSLADAQRQAMRAQMDLTNARQAAGRSLEDLRIAARQADLDQRSATLALAQAQQAMASVRANPFAAPGQMAGAQLALDQAKLAAERSTITKGRSGEDLAKATTQGVEGSSGVQSAQQAVLTASQSVGNAQQQVANSAQAVAEAQISAAEKVATAQQALGDAYRQQAIQARQGAESIQKAMEAVAAAQMGNQSAANATNAAMAKLTPTGREFVQFLRSIKPQFDAIGAAAQNGLLPGLQAGITSLLPVLPQIAGFVGLIAKALGTMAAQAGAALASPFWQHFFQVLSTQIVPALQTMGQIFGNLFKGAAQVFLALLPMAAQFGQSLVDMSKDFANVGDSPQFKALLGYITESVPPVTALLHGLGDIVGVILPPLAALGLAIVTALSKIAPQLVPLKPVLHTISDGLSTVVSVVGDLISGALPPLVELLKFLGPLLVPIAVGILAVVVGIKAFAVAKGIIEGISIAWKILSFIFGVSPIFIIITAIIAFVAVLVYAYNNSETFRNIVQNAFHVIGVAIGVLGDIFSWLYEHAVKPAFEACAVIIGWVWDNLLKPYFEIIKIEIQILGAIFGWLYDHAIKPAWDAICLVIDFAWNNIIKPLFEDFKNGIALIPTAFQVGIDLIKSIWDTLRKIVGTPVKWVIDVIYNNGIVKLWNTLADFIGAGHLNALDTSGIPSFAGGGLLGGYAPGGPDTIPALLSPGEAVLVPEVVRALGPSTILALNAEYSGRPATVVGSGIPSFAGGGIIDSVLGFVGGALGDVAKFLTDPIGEIKKLLGNAPLIDMLAHIPNKIVTDAANWLWSHLFGGGSKSAGAPAGGAQLDQWIAAAIGLTGVGPTWSIPLHTLIGRESGGDPKAINLTDSNAQAGHPSQGLMQTIPSTFAAYRDPRLSADITDPVANIVAGINYIKAVYGSIFSVQQAVGATPQGYAGGGLVLDDGGWLPPGYSTVLNATGRPEAVLTAEQFGALTLPRDGWDISGAITVDGMDARIDGRIRHAGQATGTAIAQRARI